MHWFQVRLKLSDAGRTLFGQFARHIYEPTSSVSIVTGQQGVRSPTDAQIFPLTSASKPTLGPTQPPVQWVIGALTPVGKRGRGVMLTTHPLLVPRLRNSRGYICIYIYISSAPQAPPWRVAGPLYPLPGFAISQDLPPGKCVRPAG
jgi:hypothetical protein